MDDESWDYFLSQINQCEDIDEIEKQELLRNWGYLRVFLGENWFKKEENKSHPLMGYFDNVGLSGLRPIGGLGLGIECLKNKENFDKISTRLLSKNDFEGAYYELQVGYSLFKLGVSFEFSKPRKKSKTQDILMDIDGRKIHLEVTKKKDPDDPLNYSHNFHKIGWFLLSKGNQMYNEFVFRYDILKPLSTPRTEQILTVCENLLEKAKKSGFEEFHIPNTIDLYIVKKENIDKVPQEKRVTQGKSLDFNELSRIRGTIRDKAPQLGTENPAVLSIFDSWLWPQENKEIFYSNLVNDLEEIVNQFTNLSAVIINIETYFPDDESSVKEERNYIAIQGFDEKLAISKNKVIILNEFAAYPLLLHEIEVLKNI